MPMSNKTIVAAGGTWVVRAGGAVLGESDNALHLVDADGDLPGVIYFPPTDLGMAFLERSGTVATHGIGEASFYNIITKSVVIPDVAWSYDAPAAGAERLAGHIAFDTDRVAVEEV